MFRVIVYAFETHVAGGAGNKPSQQPVGRGAAPGVKITITSQGPRLACDLPLTICHSLVSLPRAQFRTLNSTKTFQACKEPLKGACVSHLFRDCSRSTGLQTPKCSIHNAYCLKRHHPSCHIFVLPSLLTLSLFVFLLFTILAWSTALSSFT